MKLLSRAASNASKKLLFASFAVAAIGLPSVASAQTRVITAHAETASTLRCLLNHGRGCGQRFVGSASPASRPWLWWTADRDFGLGALVSWEYAGTQSANAYTTALLNGRTADVYDVKFARQQLTFYIVPPGPDGKVHYMLVRNGAPNDERADFWARNPLGLF